MYRKIIFIFIVLIVTNVAIAEESFSRDGKIPLLNRNLSTEPDKFAFAIIGDKTGGGEKNWYIFDKALEEINLLNPDFAITIGDHIQGYTTDPIQIKKMWDEFFSHLYILKVPVFLVPGNHDISNPLMYSYWKDNIGKTYYSFDYKGCHFIVISTEEHNSPEGSNISLLDFIAKDIQQNKNARHIFVFMHKPLWISDKNTWEKIEKELKNTNYSVFAGHYHRLIHDMHDDHNYVILSATGGELNEFADLPKLGLFHHFSIISVSGKDANIAIIQPGKIFPATISTKEYGERLQASLYQVKQEIPVPDKDGEVYGKLTITQTNKVDVPIKAKITIADTKGWKVTPKDMILEVSPGETRSSIFELICNADAVLNPLKYSAEILYNDRIIYKQDKKVNVIDIDGMRSIPEWIVSFPFDIPNVKDKTLNERETIVYDYYDTKLEPELDTKYKSEIKLSISDISESRKQVINLDKAFDHTNDYVISYAKTFIYAPEDMVIWAALMADDIASVFINGKQTGDTYKLKDMKSDYEFFPVALKSGWNSVMIKCADVAGDWYFSFKLNDTKSQLKFSAIQEE